MISHANLSDDIMTNTLMQLHQKLMPDMGELLTNPIRYCELISDLIYLTILKPNIAYVVHIVGQFVQAPTLIHYIALLRIIHHLCGIVTKTTLISIFIYFETSSLL